MDSHKLLIKAILEHADQYPWSVQGLGMFRLYLSEELRIHVWDKRYQIPDVSMIHNHPWDFTSEVIVGKMTNHIYSEWRRQFDSPAYAHYGIAILNKVIIKAGEGAFVKEDQGPVRLLELTPTDYHYGEIYSQKAEDVHYTTFEQGTVTLCRRGLRPDLSRDYAAVYLEAGKEFVDAKPRPATETEIREMAMCALCRNPEEWK